MSWGALGVVAYAEQISLYHENIQGWINAAHGYLASRGYASRFYEILGISDLFGGSTTIFGANVSYPVEDMGRQLAALSMALMNGMHFEFTDGKDADFLVNSMVGNCGNRMGLDLDKYLTPAEMLQLKLAGCAIR